MLESANLCAHGSDALLNNCVRRALTRPLEACLEERLSRNLKALSLSLDRSALVLFVEALAETPQSAIPVERVTGQCRLAVAKSLACLKVGEAVDPALGETNTVEVHGIASLIADVNPPVIRGACIRRHVLHRVPLIRALLRARIPLHRALWLIAPLHTDHIRLVACLRALRGETRLPED